MPIQLLTISDVAILLKISRKTCWKRIKAGQIPAFVFGGDWRVHPTVLDEWLARQAGLPVDEKPRRGRPKTNYKQKLSKEYPHLFGETVQ
jgi:excisionase family DNA binding protein